MSASAAPAARGLGGWAIPPPVLLRAVLLALVLLAPALLLAQVTGTYFAVGYGLGLAVGITTGILCGIPMAIVLTAVNVVALVAGGLAGGSPLAAAVFTGLAALAVGPANRRGLGRTIALAPVLVAVAASGTLGDATGSTAIGLALGAAWAYVLLWRWGTRQAAVPFEPRVAWTHALMLAATCSVAAYVAIATPLPHGYWIVVTLSSVIQPLANETARSSRDRVAGTLLGSLLAVAIGAIIPPWLLAATLVVVMAMFVAYALLGDGLRRVTAQTVMVVLMLAGATGAVGVDVAVQRLAWTLVGAGLVLAAGLAVERLAPTSSPWSSGMTRVGATADASGAAGGSAASGGSAS